MAQRGGCSGNVVEEKRKANTKRDLARFNTDVGDILLKITTS